MLGKPGRKAVVYVISFVALILVALFGFLIHAGLFAEVKASEEWTGEYQVVYRPHKGGYHEIGTVIDDIHAILEAEQIPAGLSFGQYFDDPFEGDTKIGDLRSHVGVMIEQKDASRVSVLESTHDFKTKIIPQGKYLVAELPFRNELSKVIGPMKVYPKFTERLREMGGEMQFLIEIFDSPNKKLTYLSPIPGD